MITSAQLQLGAHQTHHLIQLNLSISEKTSSYPIIFTFFFRNNVNPLPTVTAAIWRHVLKSKSIPHKQFPSWSPTVQCSPQEWLLLKSAWFCRVPGAATLPAARPGNTRDLHNWERSYLELYLLTYMEVKVKMKSIMKFLWAYFWFPTVFLWKSFYIDLLMSEKELSSFFHGFAPWR